MTAPPSIGGFRRASSFLLVVSMVFAGCVGPPPAPSVPWSATMPSSSSYGTGFAEAGSTLAPGVDDGDRPEGLAAAEGFGYFGVGQSVWIVDVRRPSGPILVGQTPPLPQRIGPMLWHDHALYMVLRGLSRPPSPSQPTSVSPGGQEYEAEQRRDPDSLAVFDLAQPNIPRLRQPAVASIHTVMDLVTVGNRICLFGSPRTVGGAAECLKMTSVGLATEPGSLRQSDDLHYTDVTRVAERLYATYGRVLTYDLIADDSAATALSSAITSHLSRDDWMLSSGSEVMDTTLLVPVDVGGSYSPLQPQFQVLLGVDVSIPSRPIVLPGARTVPSNTIASLKADGERLFTLERTGRCELHVYTLANGAAPRGSVALPTEGMCAGGLHFSPDEGQRIAVTGQAVLIGYDPNAVYIVDVSNPDEPVVTGGVDIQ